MLSDVFSQELLSCMDIACTPEISKKYKLEMRQRFLDQVRKKLILFVADPNNNDMDEYNKLRASELMLRTITI